MTPLDASWVFSQSVLYLTALKEFKSMAQAGEVMGVQGITIAKHIKRLEKQIGCELVVIPTDAWEPYRLTETGDYLVNVLSPMIEQAMISMSNMATLANLSYRYDLLPEPSKHHVMQRTLGDMDRNEIEMVIKARKLKYNGLGQYELDRIDLT